MIADGPPQGWNSFSLQTDRLGLVARKPLMCPLCWYPSMMSSLCKSYEDQALKDECTGTRLTKAYDVTIQRYRNSHAKIQESKMHILQCMGSKIRVKFQKEGNLWNFTQNLEPIHRKICILRGGTNLATYDILKFWHLKSPRCPIFKWDPLI